MQMTNEELAIKIQQGDDGLLPQLWEQVRKLIVMLAKRFNLRYSLKYGNNVRFEIDDLVQSGYIAVLKAVQYYDPNSGRKFSTYLGYQLKNAFADAAGIRRYEKALTTEADITSMGMNIASAGTQIGMTESEIMGVATALSSLGLEAQAGGTAISKLMVDMAVAVETGSDSLDDFARIAGMTSSEFAELFGSSATQAMSAFFSGLGNGSESAITILTEMGVTETRLRDTMLRLTSAKGIFTEAVDMANTAMVENTALIEEAQKRYATTESKLALLHNSYNNLKVAIGDALTPATKEYADVFSDVLDDVTQFVQQNPQVVKGIVALTATLATFTGALVAYTVTTKAAKVIQDTFNASLWSNPFTAAAAGVSLLVGGVVLLATATKDATGEQEELTAVSREQYKELQELNAAYEEARDTIGENEAETLLLKRQVKEATEAFEENKQTVYELNAGYEEIIKSHYELAAAYEETIKGLDDELAGSISLIAKLEKLMAAESKTAETKQEILAVVELLNEAMPELGLAYDQYADSLNMSADAIKTVIKAEIERERNAAKRDRLKKLLSDETEQEEKLKNAIEQTAAAERLLIDAQAAADAKRKELGNVSGEAAGRAYAQKLMPYALAVRNAEAEVNKLAASESNLQAIYDANLAEQAELLDALGQYSEATEGASGATGDLRAAISGITKEAEALAAAYDEAYKAALDSISGQYTLWDEAAEVVAKSAGEINKALESQISYWQDYNTNLANLTDRSAEIEGLSEMIASFADGSEGSVNAIAGMASATDTELAAMVENWQALQIEQKSVADSLAEMEIEFSATMDALQMELETAIEEMDLNNEAAQSGKNTIQGFIDGAEDMLPALQSAYAQIAQAAVDAIDQKLDIHSPSKVLELRGRYVMAGFEEGITAKEHDVITAMSDVALAGTNALTTEALSATPNSNRYGSGANPVFNINYDFTGSSVGNVPELRSMLTSRDEDLKEYILDVIEKDKENRLARAYI